MVDCIRYTPEVANDWKQVTADVKKDYPYQFRRTLDASTSSQLQSKLWLINELIELNIDYKRVALIGGWFANFITELLITEARADLVHNYEIDEDAKNISYKYNKRYKDIGKYQCSIKDVMMQIMEEDFDLVINSSCEHMFPMTKFYELNPDIRCLYALQSTDDDQYDDHINCVESPEELAEQANINNVLYSGTKVLSNGMNRFMVIGYNI